MLNLADITEFEKKFSDHVQKHMGTQLRTSKKDNKRRKRETARLIDDLTIYRIFQYDAQKVVRS